MKIELVWSNSIILQNGSSQDMIYTLPRDCNLPNTAGVYIFYRKFGDAVSAVYIGKGDNIEQRIKQQLLKNVKLMMAIKNSGAGNKMLIYGKLKAKQGQMATKIVKLLERQFISFAKLNGHDLVNIHGAKSVFPEIRNSGNLDVRKILPFKMNIRAK